jgi:hypothetical protein
MVTTYFLKNTLTNATPNVNGQSTLKKVDFFLKQRLYFQAKNKRCQFSQFNSSLI